MSGPLLQFPHPAQYPTFNPHQQSILCKPGSASGGDSGKEQHGAISAQGGAHILVGEADNQGKDRARAGEKTKKKRVSAGRESWVVLVGL